MIRLISVEDIRAHKDISKSVKDSKVNPYIDDAQMLDLMPNLGDRFYSDIRVNPTDAKYATLLDGGEYTKNENGTDYKYYNPGIKRVLVEFAYARYVLFGGYTDTPFSMVEKLSQDSRPVEKESKRVMYKNMQQVAQLYYGEVEKFILRNHKDYPLYRNHDECIEPRRSFRMNKITT